MSSVSTDVSVESIRAAVQNSKAYARLSALFDEGSMIEFDPLSVSEGGPAEVVAAFGTVSGVNVCAFAQNSDVAGGAVSTVAASKIAKVYDYALKNGAPLVGIYDSTGARLKQGNKMLASIGDMLACSNNLSGVVPQISVIAGPCLGSISLIAACADVVICAEKADFSIDTAGAAVKGREAVENGTAQMSAKDDMEAVMMARNLLTMLPANNLTAPATCEFTEPVDYSEDSIKYISDTDSFVEFSAGFGKSATVGLATLNGDTVGVVSTSAKEDKGLMDADSASKTARFVRFCDAFSIPVISFVDCAGFATMRDAAKVAHAYAEATTAKIAVVTGAAYGSAFIALAGSASGSDYTVAWPDAVISPLAPETAAAILYSEKMKGTKDQKADHAAQTAEYKATLAAPVTAAQEGFIQDVIDPSETRAKLISVLGLLSSKRVQRSPKKHSNIQL